MGTMTMDDISQTEDYKRIYAKWAGKSGREAAAIPAQITGSGQGGYTTFDDLSSRTSTSNVPAIEDADVNDTPAAAVSAPRIDCGSEKLDQYRICRRCQGAGEYKEYITLGLGATREVVKMCESDIDG